MLKSDHFALGLYVVFQPGNALFTLERETGHWPFFCGLFLALSGKLTTATPLMWFHVYVTWSLLRATFSEVCAPRKEALRSRACQSFSSAYSEYVRDTSEF